MKLDNHIVNRLLTDRTFWVELCQAQQEKDIADNIPDSHVDEKYQGLFALLSNKDNKTYYVTKSVIEKLPMLDVKRCMDIEGWKVFAHLPNFKKTFILPEGNTCIRVMNKDGLLYFCHIDFTFHPAERRAFGNDGEVRWVLLFADLERNRMAEHWLSEDGKRLAPMLYALMCFVELCDNETIVVQPNAKYGTRKAGKIINITPFPITVINSAWNITTVSGSFAVRGHMAIRWTGQGRTTPRLVYIEPFVKEGYTRRAGKLNESSQS